MCNFLKLNYLEHYICKRINQPTYDQRNERGGNPDSQHGSKHDQHGSTAGNNRARQRNSRASRTDYAAKHSSRAYRYKVHLYQTSVGLTDSWIVVREFPCGEQLHSISDNRSILQIIKHPKGRKLHAEQQSALRSTF